MQHDAYMQQQAEDAKSRQEALNVLRQLQFMEQRRKARQAAIRAQYIDSHEITG
ncbi:hypothetical protein SynBIOSU31_02085 [Synechococcus sp. BIOS-U3-1]|nr:hypothetical protein SynBIOSU31_02085 [Synechococcus sp. BIOS-U3-1]